MMLAPHQPVLLERVVELLAVQRRGVILDATVGAGGHAAALLAASGPDVMLVGLDRDVDALELATRELESFGDRAMLVHGAYDSLREILTPTLATHGPLLAVLYDLGVSSMQLDRGERGFSFSVDAPLDMRMDATSPRTAADLVNETDEVTLTRLLREGGEDRHAGRIARAMIAARPIVRTGDLADVVAQAVPAAVRHARTHPATRTFQALRIALNDELARFRSSLPQALRLLAPSGPAGAGGRVVVLAYHSGEDRIAKRVLGDAAAGCVCPPDMPVCGCGRQPSVRLLTRGSETADPEEVARNPRARSVRLRAAERTALPVPDAWPP